MRRGVSRFVFCMTVSLLFCLPALAVAQHRNRHHKRNQRDLAIIEIKSTPAGAPILIDGVQRGVTLTQPVGIAPTGEPVAQPVANVRVIDPTQLRGLS